MSRFIAFEPGLCGGCGACVVACMDQNDIDCAAGQPPFRRVYQLEEPGLPLLYRSVACRHCEDSPCMAGCPTGAIYRDGETDRVLVERSLCIGCHSCAMNCPFGVPRFDSEGLMSKCGGCSQRLKAGLEPACVLVCPQRALTLAEENTLPARREKQLARGYIHLRGDRDEKETD